MEKKEIGLILSMLVMIVRCCEGVNEYDYLQVVIQWQPATCSALDKPDCYKEPDNKFSIHGMWPSLNKGTTACSGDPFDGTQVSSLQPEISQIWPDVIMGDNKGLWKREWDKHGTCTDKTLFQEQEQYFSFTMDEYNANDLLDILGSHQITPNGQSYSKTQIYQAIVAYTSKRPGVRCNKNKLSELSQLHEISLCYDKNATGYVNCPYNANKCGNTFQWNAWPTPKASSI